MDRHLHEAISQGDYNTVEALITTGADVNSVNDVSYHHDSALYVIDKWSISSKSEQITGQMH